jgi:transcriptional regulator with XRE-family HTH domain
VATDSQRKILSSRIIKALRDERIRQGMSMTALAEKSGLSLTMISFVERELRNPTLDSLLRIAGALDVRLGGVIVKAEKGALR